MGYSFTIGKAAVEATTDYSPAKCFDSLQPTVEPCEGNPEEIHRDEWDCETGPTRLPSYSTWAGVLKACPALGGCFEGMQQWYRQSIGNNGDHSGAHFWIPIRTYADTLPMIEIEAEKCSEEVKARALWFVRWSRHALRLYGDLAAFATPGEWEGR